MTFFSKLRATSTAFAASMVVLTAVACGGGDSGPYLALVMEPEEGVEVGDIDAALEGAVRVIERRGDELDLGDVRVRRLSDDRLLIQVSGATIEEALEGFRTGLLQFCEPLTDASGNVAVLTGGEVRYEPQSCRPARDDAGNIMPPAEVAFWPWAPIGGPGFADNPPVRAIIWTAATAVLDDVELTLDGRWVVPNTSVIRNATQQPMLVFEVRDEGEEVLESVTERLLVRNYPLAVFMDGEPILDSNGVMITPLVEAAVLSRGAISGLSEAAAERLSTLLNTGAFPIPLRIIEQSEVVDSSASERCRSGSRLVVSFEAAVEAEELADSLTEEGFDMALIHTVESSPPGGSIFVVYIGELEGGERDRLEEALVKTFGSLLDPDGRVIDAFWGLASVVC